MIDKLIGMTLNDIKNGYSYNGDKFICNICGKEYEDGEIFKIDDRYYEASKMIKLHIQREHDDMFEILASNDKKYTGITENQKDILKMINSGMNDNEIAKATGVAPATIRHQRFIFREKAKQAKLYLAIYEVAMQGADNNKKTTGKNEEIIDVHKDATMVDERYVVTKTEEEQIIQSMFSSLQPLILKTFSTKEKKKIIILKKITEQFERDRRYSEKEINIILKNIYDDFVLLRRYLIEYGFMDRTNDCKEYWLK
jgi:hypothetical protein